MPSNDPRWFDRRRLEIHIASLTGRAELIGSLFAESGGQLLVIHAIDSVSHHGVALAGDLLEPPSIDLQYSASVG